MSNHTQRETIRAYMREHDVNYTTAKRSLLAVTNGPGAPLRMRPGQRVRFHPRGSDGNWWWTVRVVDGRYAVATQPARFGSPYLHYTVIDLEHNRGPSRSSLNTLGGGYDVGLHGEKSHEVVDALRSGLRQLSNRRIIEVEAIEVEEDPTNGA